MQVVLPRIYPFSNNAFLKKLVRKKNRGKEQTIFFFSSEKLIKICVAVKIIFMFCNLNVKMISHILLIFL